MTDSPKEVNNEASEPAMDQTVVDSSTTDASSTPPQKPSDSVAPLAASQADLHDVTVTDGMVSGVDAGESATVVGGPVSAVETQARSDSHIPGEPGTRQQASSGIKTPSGSHGMVEELLAPGQEIGKIRIVKELGRGGMGAVYLGQHMTLDVPVAVKVLPPSVAAKHEQFVDRFMREGRLAARIKHANAMSVMDADLDQDTGMLYMVLEFVDGGSVKDLLRAGPIGESRALQIVQKVALALESAAEHTIVHRDIKPDNIMLTSKGEVKLADLGLAKQFGEDDGKTLSNAIMGTPAYMSPEQAQDTKNTDARGDIYSLGATLFHMLTGKAPFEGETTYAILTAIASKPSPDPRTLRPDLSETTAAICLKMMAKKKEDRYQSAKELLQDLQKVLQQEVKDTAMLSASSIMIAGGASAVSSMTSTASTGVGSPSQSQGDGAEVNPMQKHGGLILAGVVLLLSAAVVGFVLTRPRQPVPTDPGQVQPPLSKPSQIIPVSKGQVIVPRVNSGQVEPGQVGIYPTGKPAYVEESVAPVAAPSDPVLDELVALASSSTVKRPDAEILKDAPVVRQPSSPWPSDEVRVLAFGASADEAESKARKQALSAILAAIVTEDEQAKHTKLLNAMVEKKYGTYTTPVEAKTGKVDGKSVVWAAEAIAVPPGILVNDLTEAGVEIQNVYTLLGRPTIGIEIKDLYSTPEGDEKTLAGKATQKAVQKIFSDLGVQLVDVGGFSKEEQLKKCDVLIRGTNRATYEASMPLPGGTVPYYRYSATLSVDVTLAATGRVVPMEDVSFRPVGKESLKFMGTSPEASAKLVTKACADGKTELVASAVVDTWIDLVKEGGYLVGIAGFASPDAVIASLSAVPGVTSVVQHGIANGELVLRVDYTGSALRLQRALTHLDALPLTVTYQRGLWLKFAAKK